MNFSMNSVEYWNNRFDTDWDEYGGNEQTKFFASIMLDMLPQWFLYEVNENKYSVCDLGCAQGDALSVYRRAFRASKLCGEDFSKTAIEIAKRTYPEYSYKIADIMNPESEETYPVVICSNVLEHFRDMYGALEKVCERMSRYAVILVPYREEPGVIEEHENVFSTKDIPLQVGENRLVYAKTLACDSPFYPYEQILLIYAKNKSFTVLADVVEEVSSDKYKLLYDECMQRGIRIEKDANELEKCKRQLSDYVRDLGSKEDQIRRFANKNDKLTAQLNDYVLKLDEREAQQKKSYEIIENLSSQLTYYTEKLKEKEALLADEQEANLQMMDFQVYKELEGVNQNLVAQIAEYAKQFEACSEQIAALQARNQALDANLQMAQAVLLQKDTYIAQAQDFCNHFATGKLSKLNHFLFRFKRQFLRGSKEDRKEFRSWLRGKRKKTNRDIGEGRRFNPWMITKGPLDKARSCQPDSFEIQDVLVNAVPGAINIPAAFEKPEASQQSLSGKTAAVLQEKYDKYDVIVLSVIDYSFRYQRPQHFADRFAVNGHRVFYVNANFIRPDSVKKEKENLYLVDFSNAQYNAIYGMDGKSTLDWMKEKFTAMCDEYAIRDAVVIVDYPNWVYGAEYLKEKYGFRILTDYMDDYTGFLGTTEDFLKDNCIRLLQSSDAIAASSQFLYDVASKHTDASKISIIRNGTEVEHFYQAIAMEKEDKPRKVIGYYGAVAHWFAWEKVCYLAKKFPQYDVVIVGDVTEYRDELEKHKNIKLLGEKPYKELPKFLADFDVCLIPFDTSTDLIKATNPVKFYEYLSAGKKVVATEIPELMPFRDEYVYMSNEDEKFAEYVEMCLEGKDTLKGREECIAFARENDWQERFNAIAEACIRNTPKVSVIVLTYNNKKMNQECIESILNKTAYANYEIIVVDNHSVDDTVDYLKQLDAQGLSNVRVILNEDNLGFAGGNNCGIKASDAEYVILLNNDTVVTRGWMTNLVKHLENDKEYAMCNPVTNSIGNESKIVSKYTNEKELNKFAYLYNTQHMGVEYKDVDRLPLFSTIIRKSVIDEIGMLDEEYAVGMFEDDDYTERVLNAGYKIVIADDAFVHHINNGSFKKLEDAEYKKVFEKNKKLFEKKWNREWKMPKYREGVDWDSNLKVGL